MRRYRIALAIAAIVSMAGAAQAGVVLSDNFNAENGGASALNYTDFTNWNVEAPVDLFHSGDFGVTCAGGSGSCVGLKGTTGTLALLSKSDFSLTSGDQVLLSFQISGDQRDPAVFDDFGVWFFFPTPTVVENYSLGGAYGDQLVFPGDITTTEIVGGNPTSGYNQPFLTYDVLFTARSAGQVQIGFSAFGSDTVGPVLDNVQLSIDPVPEPATWAMMIGGLGLMGSMLRSRRRALAGL